ncbi:MAG: hypothetical protein NTW50_01630 [Candidatus Berkelbacteria bacterium]|nr:hypothetical protein [Candidatus Berkelbacteria bacterium]
MSTPPSKSSALLFGELMHRFRLQGQRSVLVAALACLFGDGQKAINAVNKLAANIKVGDKFDWRIQVLIETREQERLRKWNTACSDGLRACTTEDKVVLENLPKLMAGRNIDLTDPEMIEQVIAAMPKN